jgi:hypothetical protein
MRNLFLPGFCSTVLLSLLTPNTVSAQCVDPPADGTFIEYVDQIISFTDNYHTYMDVRIPSVAPSACGWPMIVLVHTSGTSRTIVTSHARGLASRGFVTVTYDVRGQGPGMTLNDPQIYGREIVGIRERLDMFEIMEEAERLFPDKIDFDRIGVTGRSQGGLHSFLAAAHSGKTFPVNPWRTAPAPVITAVAPVNFGGEYINSLVPDNQTFSEMMARQLYEDEAVSGVHHPPAFFAFIQPFIDAEDYEGVITALFDPALDPGVLLQDSTVSIMAQLAWDDKYGPINQLVRNWENYLLPGTRKLLNHSVGGHSTANNFYELMSKDYRRIMFFEQELKGINRGLDNWANYRFAISPISAVDYNSEFHVWDVIESDVYPLAGTYIKPYFPGPGNALHAEVPPGTDFYSVSHRANGITQQDYFDYLPEPEALVFGMPMDTVEFVMPPIESGVLLLGAPKLELNIKCPQPDFQVSVALFDHTTDRYLTSGQQVIRGHNGSDEIHLDLEMGMCSYYLAKGTVLRAEVRNISWHKTPFHITYLYAMPLFTDFDVTMRTGGAGASKLELPLVDYANPILTGTLPFVIPHNNENGKLALRCYDEETAGWSYQILASLSGTSPGSSYHGTHVPLNFDGLTKLIYTDPGSLPISHFAGTLNAKSEAEANAFLSRVPNLPPTLGQFDVCAIIASPDGSQVRVSNIVHVEFD